MVLKQFKAVLWDFNGTIVDDVANSLWAINVMLKERNLPLLSLNEYRSVFNFPVKNYYEKIGFDFNQEDWSVVAEEFINLYWSAFYDNTRVFKDVLTVIEYFNKKQIPQFIVSAMQHDSLVRCVKKLKIHSFFESIYGIDNHFASDKHHIAEKMLKDNSLNARSVCFIGDTVHDFEVASNIGVTCLLVNKGHQNKERLLETGCMVVDKHLELIE